MVCPLRQPALPARGAERRPARPVDGRPADLPLVSGGGVVIAYQRVLDALTDHGSRVYVHGRKASASCPSPEHGNGRGDRRPSLSIKAANGKALIRCQAGCATESVLAALGLGWSDLFDQPGTPTRPARAPRPHPLVPDPGHLLNRIAAQTRIESTPGYWLAKADELDAAGCPDEADACRHHARLLGEDS